MTSILHCSSYMAVDHWQTNANQGPLKSTLQPLVSFLSRWKSRLVTRESRETRLVSREPVKCVFSGFVRIKEQQWNLPFGVVECFVMVATQFLV